MRAIWRGRSRVDATFWRLYFVICADGEPVGMRDLIGTDFATLGTVNSARETPVRRLTTDTKVAPWRSAM